jgi:beta-aspartyl-peptidase (threonine type)
MRLVLAKSTVDRLSQAGAAPSAQLAISHLAERIGGLGGIIVLDRQGGIGHAFNTPRLAFAYMHHGLAGPVLGI